MKRRRREWGMGRRRMEWRAEEERVGGRTFEKPHELIEILKFHGIYFQEK